MKHYLLLLCMLCIGMSAFAQTVTVTDINTMAPLAGVTVRTASAVIGKTDARGQLDISGVRDVDSLFFSLSGFLSEHYALDQLGSLGHEIHLFQNTYSLDEIVVSASKFEEKRKDIAQPVEVLRAKDLAFQNQSTMADVMQSTGNVLVQKSQLGGGSPIIRGFETNKVLMVVDGVRMNNAIYRGGHLQNIITLDNTMMDKVEILFGPGSTVYGSDALGGVMAFFTKNPTLNTQAGLLVKANAFTRYASASGEFSGHADVSLGGQKFGSLTSITYSQFGDLRQGNLRNPFYGDWGKRSFYQAQINGIDSMVVNPDSNIQVGSGYSQYDILQKFTFQQNSHVSHGLNFQYSTSSDVPRYDRLTQLGGNGKPKFAEWYYGPQKRLFGSYTLNLNADKGFYDHGRIIVAYQNIEESRNDRRFGSDNLNHRIEQLNIVSLNADFTKKIKTNELRYGLEGTYNMVNSTATREHPRTGLSEPLDTRYPNGGSSMRSIALYATHSWEIVPSKLILNDGIRLSNVGLNASWTDTTFFPFPFKSVAQNNTAVNGNLGLVYMPGAAWRFTLLGSTGFRAPNVDDLSKVFESVPGNVIVPNPDLKPENTYNLDLGISKTIARQVTVGGNAWYTLYRNAITTSLGTFNGVDSILYDGQLSRVTTSVNATKAYLYGGNAYLAFEFNDHFRFTNTINYTYGRLKTDTTDYPLDHIAPLFGKSSLQLSIKKFRAEFFVLYSGWKSLKNYNLVGEDNIDNATALGMPAWMTLNVRAAYQINKYVQVQAAVENILDQNYRVFASNIGAPGRNIVLTLRGTF
jgi:hemoglobin/transferrin/lactoferrin receptor protein